MASSSSIKQRRLLHLKHFLFLYLNVFIFSIVFSLLLPRQRLKHSLARGKLKRETKHTDVATRLHYLFDQVAEFVHVIRFGHAGASVFRSSLTPHIVGNVAQ